MGSYTIVRMYLNTYLHMYIQHALMLEAQSLIVGISFLFPSSL